MPAEPAISLFHFQVAAKIPLCPELVKFHFIKYGDDNAGLSLIEKTSETGSFHRFSFFRKKADQRKIHFLNLF